MFPSSNNGNVDPIYYYNDQQVYNKSSTFFNDISSSFKQQQDHHLLQEQISSSFPFFPFFDSLLEFQDHFDTSFHNNQLPLNAISSVGVTDIVNMADSEGMFNVKTEIGRRKSCNKRNISHDLHEMNNNEPKRKTSKKDRHSKINTAQGPRDRRMRLSLKVAREFFDLQDKLGFDKASKTVEWLLIQAKDAIMKLTQSLINQNINYSSKTASSTNNSDCEVISHAVDAVSTIIAEAAAVSAAVSTNEQSVSKTKTTARVKKTRRKTRDQVRKSAVTKTTSKETREKARARARERTIEKRRKIDESVSKMMNEDEKENELNKNLSSFETTGEESVTQSHTINNSISTTSMDMLTEIEEGQICSSDDIHNQQESRFDRLFNSMVIMKKWTQPLSISDHLYNTSIPEELQNDDQMADFQYGFGRSWDDQMGHHSV